MVNDLLCGFVTMITCLANRFGPLIPHDSMALIIQCNTQKYNIISSFTVRTHIYILSNVIKLNNCQRMWFMFGIKINFFSLSETTNGDYHWSFNRICFNITRMLLNSWKFIGYSSYVQFADKILQTDRQKIYWQNVKQCAFIHSLNVDFSKCSWNQESIAKSVSDKVKIGKREIIVCKFQNLYLFGCYSWHFLLREITSTQKHYKLFNISYCNCNSKILDNEYVLPNTEWLLIIIKCCKYFKQYMK